MKQRIYAFLRRLRLRGNIFMLLCLSYWPMLQAQTLDFVESPPGYEGAWGGCSYFQLVIGNRLYLRYDGEDGNADLGIWNGSSLQIIPSPAGYEDPNAGMIGASLNYNNQYYCKYQGNDGHAALGRYNGSSLSIIPNPAGFQAAGFTGNSQVLGSLLYLRYQDDAFVGHLMQYNGSSLSAISSPADYSLESIEGSGGSSVYLRYRNEISGSHHFAVYNGSTLTILPNPAGFENNFKGYWGSAVDYNGNTYLQFRSNTDNYALVRYDGSSLLVIPSPANYSGSFGGYNREAILFDGDLYLKYVHSNFYGSLARYDGSSLSIIPNPVGYTGNYQGYIDNPILYQGQLYLGYQAIDQHIDLAAYDGSTLTIIPSPTGTFGTSFGCKEKLGIFNSKLYMRYMQYGNISQLAQYDGNNLNLIPNPDGYDQAYRGLSASSALIQANRIAMKFWANDGNYDLVFFEADTLRILESPIGYEGQNVGLAFDKTLLNGELILQYQDNNSNQDFAVLQETVLPLRLSHFSASRQERGSVLLHWEVEDQSGIDRYVVQRSVDGIHFKDLGSLKANAEKSAQYQMTDQAPEPGRNYYRLRIEEPSGQSYSLLVSVLLENAGQLQAFPNPFEQRLHISGLQEQAPVVVTDAFGKTMEYFLPGDANVILQCADWPAGLYLLHSGDQVLRIFKAGK